MKPHQPDTALCDDLFRSRLDQIINRQHEFVQLADKIDWDYRDGQVEPFFAVEGRPAIPSRLMAGLHVLKHMHQLSDEAVCAPSHQGVETTQCGGADHRSPESRSLFGANYLKGTQGDKLNALLSGAGYNFRLLLKWFRLFFAKISGGWWDE